MLSAPTPGCRLILVSGISRELWSLDEIHVADSRVPVYYPVGFFLVVHLRGGPTHLRSLSSCTNDLIGAAV
jgi:hypothetical protein